MLFFRPIYLQDFDIHCCRCSFWDQRICTLLFFELADTFHPTCHVNCIYILPFLGFEDTPFANFASTFHIFDNMRILLIEILHPQFSKIHYRRYIRNARPVKFYYLIHQACDNVLKKILDMNFCEYKESDWKY